MNVLVKELKNLDQDFEWYPTTDIMIDCISADIKNNVREYNINSTTILDCGAGDGRVLNGLTYGGAKYAIEKSKRLIEEMPDDIFIIGTEFFSSTLIDKQVDVLFSNPPYSEYEAWVEKIIIEANAKLVYLIIPKRWQNSIRIKDAIESRKAKSQVIGSFDFLNAEREARANVDIVMVNLCMNGCHIKVNPFDLWFDQNFSLSANKEKLSDYDKKKIAGSTLKEKLTKKLVAGAGVVPALVELYNHEMAHLQSNFMAICRLDADIMKELDVNVNGVKKALEQRIIGLKNKYWNELFNNYDKIIKRLTHSSREQMLQKLMGQTSIDFTESNIYAVTVWVIKNANKYFDKQLVQLVERMVAKANVTLYKSNKRVFTNNDWRYGRKPEELERFGLELRIILENIGGISVDNWHYSSTNGLSDNAHNFLDDIIVVANNLMFETSPFENSRQITKEWKSNKTQEFCLSDYKKTLMNVKAFKNGNLHIKFNQDFIRTLNVEFGRLKGWLKNPTEASEELNIPIKDIMPLFKANFQLTQTNGLKQLGMK